MPDSIDIKIEYSNFTADTDCMLLSTSTIPFSSKLFIVCLSAYKRYMAF